MVGMLEIPGLIDRTVQPGDGGPAKIPYVKRALRLDRIGGLFGSPLNVLHDVYGWNDPAFDGAAMLERLRDLLVGASAPASIDTTVNPHVLHVFTADVSARTDLNPRGIQAKLLADIPANVDFTIPLNDSGFALELVIDGDLRGGATILLQPPANLSIKPVGGTLQGAAMVRLVKSKPGGGTVLILGSATGSRFEAAQIKLGIGTSVQWDVASNSARGDFQIGLDLHGGNIVLNFKDGDSFLSSLLPGDGFQFGFDLGAGWSSSRGVFFTGSAALELNLPLHFSVLGVDIQQLHVLVKPSGTDLEIDTSITAGATLGPLKVAVDRVGFKTDLAFHKGNLGPLDIGFGFKPPTGLGIVVDAGIVVGGGYISFDPDKGEYAGILELTLAGIVQLKVIGLLDTKMPDGSSGWAFLLIITAEFPPMQLGFGFTLNGVGGLAGIHRTMVLDALRAGLRAHTLDSILFPPDPVANAPRIISDLRTIFPPADGRYVFGPMLELGWGTPTLITLALGLILEVPDPVRLAILGQVKAALPTEDVALIELHIDILGTLDFGAKLFAIDGSLYDSRVLVYAIAGDMALRLSWGDDPNFAFSCGGLNPHFQPPVGFPHLARMSVSIGSGDNPRLSSNSYIAVTSNSAQFGANVDLYASAAGFTIHGFIGFDVLFIFSPFHFRFDFAAGLDVDFKGHSLCSIHVDGTVEGPTPWHLHGHAELHILFFSVGATVDLTWGDDQQISIPSKPVLPELTKALADPRSWNAALPPDTSPAVSLATQKPDTSVLVVHPLGSLTVREKVVPLDVPLTRFGNATPSDGHTFRIAGVTVDGSPETINPVTDLFARGQFVDLSDTDKIGAKSYEAFDAGVTIGSSDIRFGHQSPRDAHYQDWTVPDVDRRASFIGRSVMVRDALLASIQSSAAALSPLKNTGDAKYVAFGTKSAVAVDHERYVVASTVDLRLRNDVFGAAASQYAATSALNAHLAAHPEDHGMLQVIPVFVAQ